MSLKLPLVQHCPLLLQQDVLSLSPFFEQKDHALHDNVVDASHPLHGEGTMLAVALGNGTTYADLVNMARGKDVSESDVCTLLGFLNLVGGLHRKRTLAQQPQALLATASHLFLSVRYSPLSTRYFPTFANLARSTLRATTPVLLAIGVVAATGWAAGLVSLHLVIAVTFSSQLLFVASIVIHEQAHVWVLLRYGVPTSILQRGLHLGVIHKRPTAKAEILSALAGPAAGTLLCLAVTIASWLLGQRMVSLVGVCLGLLHACSLLPLYGDGSSLISALHRKDHT